MNSIEFTRDSFSYSEDWQRLCEEVGADPGETYSIIINFDANKAEINIYC